MQKDVLASGEERSLGLAFLEVTHLLALGGAVGGRK
jgi:hypothetical protein